MPKALVNRRVELTDSGSQQGGESKVSNQQGGEPVKTNDEESDDEGLHEVGELLKSAYSEDEKTTAKPDETANTPDKNDDGHKIVETSDGYTVTLAPMTDGDTDDHVVGQRISKVHDGDREEIKEPEYKNSYSPSWWMRSRNWVLMNIILKMVFKLPSTGKSIMDRYDVVIITYSILQSLLNCSL